MQWCETVSYRDHPIEFLQKGVIQYVNLLLLQKNLLKNNAIATFFTFVITKFIQSVRLSNNVMDIMNSTIANLLLST